MNIDETLKSGIEILKRNNIDNAIFKARILLKEILCISKEELMIYGNKEMSEENIKKFQESIKKICENIPLQYITHHQEFFGYDFYVDENVLIPQPDTEILVEECIKISTKLDKLCKTNIKILDLCTGSGAIAISLAKNIEYSSIVASDISEKALEVAKKNSIINDVKIEFIYSDLYENIKGKFNIIVSNPPYIKTKVIETLSEEVKNEPYLALDGGEDGLMFYKRIIKESKEKLKENGYLLLEIGFDQKQEVIDILKENNYKNIYSKKDLGNNDRIVVAQI